CTTRLSMQPVSSAGDRQGSKECHIAAPPIREDAPQLTASPYHYGLMPANFTTSAHFSVSSAINAPNSVGVIGIGSALRPLIRALTCGSARPAAILLLSLSMIAAGVPRGAPIPTQPLASSPWKNPATVGKSGTPDERDALVTANARSSPALM